MKSPLRENMWLRGPDPCPKSSMAERAPVIKSLALFTASSRLMPRARLEAMAEDSVQPVPWLLGLSIRVPSNQKEAPRVKRKSEASRRPWPPLTRTFAAALLPG